MLLNNQFSCVCICWDKFGVIVKAYKGLPSRLTILLTYTPAWICHAGTVTRTELLSIYC